MFSLTGGRCTEQYMTCSHNTTLGFGDFDFQKISSYMVYTTSGPKRILIDHSNQRLRLKPGDLLGVRFPHSGPTAALKTSSSGSTLFYSSSMVNDTNSTTLKGNRFPITAESPAQVSFVPAIAFFYSVDSESKLGHVYQNIGHANVLTSIGNSITRVNDTKSICLQEDIKGLQLYFPEVFSFAEAVNVTGGITQGSNVTFYWDFGDKNNATSLVPWVEHVFNHTVGLKTVSIVAGNDIRVEAVWCTVLVQERIMGLQFKDTTLLPIENGTIAEIAWILLNGSHVDFTLNITYPDGFIDSKNLTNVKAPTATFFGKYNTTLTQPGWYRIEITASNRLNNVTLKGNLSVQRVVHGVSMDSPKILKTNQRFNFTIILDQGDEIRYLLNTTDGNIINTTERLIPFNYTKAGRYDAYLIASNDISSVAVKCGQIIVQDVIEGLQFVYPKILKTNQTFNFTILLDQGDEISNLLNTTDGNIINTTERLIPFAYTKAGRYDAYLIASNDISSVAVKCGQIIVQDVIEGLQFVYPKILKTNQTFNFTIPPHQGDEIRYLLNTMDGNIINTTERLIPFVYTKAGRYDAYLIASNDIGSEAVKCGQIIVQDMIEGLHFVYPKILKTNQAFNFTIPPHQGDEIRYLLNTMDGNIINTTERLIPFVYTKAGRYDAYLIASNDIGSEAVKCGQIIVQDVIEGLQFVSFNHTVAVNAQAEINWILTQGSELDIRVNYGDESSTFVNRSVSVSDLFVAISKHNYSKPGEYLVIINVTNLVDSKEIHTSVYVETPGNGGVLAIGRYNLTRAVGTPCNEEKILYVRVHDVVTATAKVKNGTNIYGYLDFGDNSSVHERYFHREFPVDGWTERNTYSQAGKYYITTTFSNRNPEDVNQNCTVIVQNPVNVVMVTSDSPKKTTERNVTFMVSFPGSLQASGPLHYQWRYGDNKSHESDNRRKIHLYPNRCGVYTATVNVSNQISFGFGQTEVVVQDEVKDLKWFANYTKLNVDYSRECSDFVLPNNTFPFDHEVAFSAHADGTNVSYTWSFPSGVNKTNSSCTHKFAKDLNNKIVLTAENAVSSETKIISLELEKEIQNVSFVNDGPSTQNSLVNLTLNMTQDGQDSCFLINLTETNFGKMEKLKSSQSTGRLVDECKDVKKVVSGSKTFPVTYESVGEYTVSLYARNRVSCVYQVSKVAVVQDVIEGLQFVSFNHTVAVNAQAEINWILTQGSELDIRVNYGDESSTFVNRSVSVSDVFVAISKHNYSKPGEYLVIINVTNLVDSKEIHTSVYVETPGNGGVLVIGRYNLTRAVGTPCNEEKILYVRVHDVVTATAKVKNGTNIYGYLDFGDNSSVHERYFHREFPVDGWTERNTYSQAGKYYITTTFSNRNPEDVNQNCTVIVQNPVNVVMVTSDSPKKTTERNVTFMVSFPGSLQASGPLHYQWRYGDNKSHESDNRRKIHLYPNRCGVYTATVNVSNQISFGFGQTEVVVQDEVKDLIWFANYTKLNVDYSRECSDFVLPNNTFPFDHEVAFSAHADGTNVSYTWSFPSGVNKTNSSCTHKFAKDLNNKIVLTAENAVSSETKIISLELEKEIQNVSFVNDGPSTQNSLVNLTLNMTQDGQDSCFLINLTETNFGKMEKLKSSQSTGRLVDECKDVKKVVSGSKTFPVTYESVGEYTVSLYARNRVSCVYQVSKVAVVQDVIEGLQFVSFNHTVAVNAQAEINWILTQGSELDIRVNYGDESSTFVNRSVSVSDVFVAISKHNYSKPGEYLVIINVTNLVDSKEIHTSVYVETPGNGGVLVIGRYNLTRAVGTPCNEEKILYVRVHDVVTATAKVKNGTNIYGYLDFGDNSSVHERYFHREFPVDGWTERNTYSQAGKYYITTTFSNRNPEDVNQNCTVIVQNPVNVVMVTSDSPKKTTERNVTFMVSFPGSLQASGPLHYQWRYGDNKSHESDNRRKIHLYPNRCGVYTATVNVSNQISFGFGQTEVVVQDEVKDLKWFANYTKLNVDYSRECSDFVLPNNTFPFDHEVAFSAYANGTNVSYTWSFPSGVNKTNSSCTHKFAKNGTNRIVLTAENAVSFERKIISLELEKEIQNVSFVNDGPSTQNSLVNLTLNMTQDGQDSCFLINLTETNFGKMEKLKSSQSTGRLVDECKDVKKVVSGSKTFPVRYESVGEYPVSLYARNRVSCVYQVSKVAVVQDVIEGLQFVSFNHTVAVNAQAEINWILTQGSELDIRVNYGDESSTFVNRSVSVSDVFVAISKHNYSKPGEYLVIINVTNLVDSKEIHTSVYVETPGNGGVLAIGRYNLTRAVGTPCNEEKILYVRVNDVVTATAKVKNGTNINGYLDFGDNSSVRVRYFHREFPDDGWTERNIYSVAGEYYITTTFSNKNPGDVNQNCTVIVQNPVKDLKWFANYTKLNVDYSGECSDFVLPNNTFPFDHEVAFCAHADGTNVSYTWSFPSGVNKTNSSCTHKFAKNGTSSIVLTAENAVSSETKIISLELEKEIQNVSFVNDGPSTQNSLVNLTLNMTQDGQDSCFLINLTETNFGTMEKLKSSQSTGRLTDECKDVNTVVNESQTFRVTYKSVGEYPVSLYARNRVSCVYQVSKLVVQDVIEGLQFVSFNHTVAVNAQAEINWILTQGSELDIRVNYGDESSTFVNRSVSVSDVFVAISKHNYSKPGEYLVIINVTNLVDSKEINTTVYVETPSNGGVLAIGRYNLTRAGNKSCNGLKLYIRVNDSVTATAKVKNGTNIYGYLDFGDNSSVRVRYFHREFPDDGWTERNIYSVAGEYYITTIFSNRNPKDVNQNCTVIVQNPVKDLKWFANYTKLNVDYRGKCSDFVLPNNTFPFDHEVAFSAYADGTNVSYTWSFPSGVNKTNSSCNHKFEVERNNTIVLTAANAVSIETKIISLELEREIQNVSFVNDGPSTQNSLVNLTLNMTQDGQDSCFLINLTETNLGKMEKLKSSQSTGRLVDECKDVKKVVSGSKTFPVRYESVGEYPVSLYARNRVSCVYEVSEVAVARGFCTYPVISVPGFEEGVIREFKRSEKISIKTHTILNCFNYSTSLRWEIPKKCDGQQQILDTQGIDMDRSELLIPANVLNYCREVEARFTVNMTEAPGVSKVKTVKFAIKKSPLRAIISGGSERTVGFNHLVEIDARESYDPDAATKPGNWTFAWFCHRANEHFTLPANLTNLPPVPTAKPATNGTGNDSKVNATNGSSKDLGGCFKFGPGRMNFTSLKITFNASNMKAGQFYVITFAMYKKGRNMTSTTQKIEVKLGDPPTLTIT